MKQCSKCGEWKPKTEFNKAKYGKDGLSADCKACKHEHYVAHSEAIKLRSKRYYYQHRDVALQQAKEARIRNKAKRLDFMNEIKTNCVKCDENRKYLVEFHHIDHNVKKSNIGNYKAITPSLVEEIKKCICLCRNCHFEFHYFYGNNPSDPLKSLTEYLGNNPYTLVPIIEVHYDE